MEPMDISPYVIPQTTRYRELKLDEPNNPTKRSLSYEDADNLEDDETKAILRENCLLLDAVCGKVKHGLSIGFGKFKDDFFIAIHIYGNGEDRSIAMAYCPSVFDGRTLQIAHGERNHFVLDCSTGLIGTLERTRNKDDRMDARLFQDGQEWKLELVRGVRIVLTQDNFNPRVY
jgi:hypothetical protein